ncbi:MAG: efflux RND transporter periplasmic adaptor subunit [Planctomycetaceae bacterium]
MRNISLVLALIVVCMLGCANDKSKSSKADKHSPAKVEMLPKESNLANVTLTPEAFERLGVTTATAKIEPVSRTKTFGGEITIPPGEQAVIVAPVSGTIQLPERSSLPKPGTAVERGLQVIKFIPLLTPERFVPTAAERSQIVNAQASMISLQMTADGDIKLSIEEVNAARIALNRAQTLLKDRVGSQRAVDDAQAQLALAEARYKVASERKKVLDKLTEDMENGKATPIPISSPISGIIRSLPVTPGQIVSTGSTLFEVVNLEEVWIRVPVYVGLLKTLNLGHTARVQLFGEEQQGQSVEVEPVTAPPAADPLSSTADLFYKLPNPDGRYRPGEKLSVTIVQQGTADQLVVPVNSILFDIDGGTWVYEKTGELQFRRARVELEKTTTDYAIINRGISSGTEVVVDGAAEIFGTEFGAGK